MYDSAIAHIVYASDDGFAEILGVSLVSLFENSGDMKGIRVYILDSGISKHNREKIEEVCIRYQRSLPVWLKARNITEELGMRVATDGDPYPSLRGFLLPAICREILKGFCIWTATLYSANR